MDLFLALGFVQSDEDRLIFVGDDLKVLQEGRKEIDKILEPIEYKHILSDKTKVQNVPWSQFKWEVMEENFKLSDPDVCTHQI